MSAATAHVFTLSRTPYANVGHAKARLDRLIAEATGAPLPSWRLHDLRRTAATALQRLGTRLEVIEDVLGHVAGSRAGIVGVYQRHRFEAEAAAALTAWADHVSRLIAPNGSAEVVPFARKG